MIPVYEPLIGKEEMDNVIECLLSGWISSKGKFISEFEKEFAKYLNVRYASSCNNGTSALHLALMAIGINEGDEVIVPVSTYIATANAVKYCNATPVFVDVDEDTWNIDIKEIEKKITKKTKAIIVVHLYGNPCDMDEIIRIARKKNLYVLEDCAESLGSTYGGKHTGTIGDVGCFSFFGNKVITTGEGGMCVSNDKGIIDEINRLKNHYSSEDMRYVHSGIGYNYRLTNIQAAIGLAQLKKLPEILKLKKRNYELLKKKIHGDWQKITPTATSNYWMNVVLLGRKKKVMEALEKEGIETRPFFYPITNMKPYKNYEEFVVAEMLNENGVNLPSSPNLTEEQIDMIAKIVEKECVFHK